MSHTKPITVSVVIPSLNRPQIVIKAVQSALAQTLKSIEVIVVVDGPDEATVSELEKVNDPRLKIKSLPENVGCADSRNEGVAEAEGKWIAFLDDDDEWLPQKLELQLAAANKSLSKFPIIASRYIAKSPTDKAILPKRLPNPKENISEFLFVRESLFERAESIQTSTFFTTKELLQIVPFTKKLRKHVDWDWLIRASSKIEVTVEVIPEVLVTRYCEEDRERITNVKNWQFAQEWICSIRDYITPKAYAGFLLRVATRQASIAGDRQAFLPLLKESFSNGQPRAIDLLSFFLLWLIPLQLRQQLRSLLVKKQKVFKN
ncbi:MAG: glycosyltransferase [Cyanobacteria bacterium P01_A01_bin.83]